MDVGLNLIFFLMIRVLAVANGEKTYSSHLAEMHQQSPQGLSNLHVQRLPQVIDWVRQCYCATGY